MNQLSVQKKASSQKRAWQRMLSGRRLDLLDPSPLDVELEDIAHGLARVARWNGQTKGEHIYSVAQHSILVMRIIQASQKVPHTNLLLASLLHDAPEYVMGDIISPFKHAMGGDYKAMEDRLLEAIHIRFSLPRQLSQADQRLIKKSDKTAAFFEATILAGFDVEEAQKFFGPPMIEPTDINDFEMWMTPLAAMEAQKIFVEFCHQYTG